MEKQSLLTRVPSVYSFHRTRLTTGTALWLGVIAMAWAQQHLQRPLVTPTVELVPPSAQTLTAVLQQNYDTKLQVINAALEAGTLLPDSDVSGIIRHRVQAEDNLWRLTQMYQVDAAAITISNGITAQTPFSPGQELLIPRREGIVHTVASGETLGEIASRYQVDQSEIIQATPLTDRNYLRTGQQLLIPGQIPYLLAARNGEPLPTVDAIASAVSTPTTPAVVDPEVAPATTAAPIAAAPVAPVHVIRSGDTLEEIAIAYDLSVAELRRLNPEASPQTLQPGQEIVIAAVIPVADPAPSAADVTVAAGVSAVIPSGSHTIRVGDTLEAIAITYDMSISELQALNPGVGPFTLQPGQELAVTTQAPAVAAEPIASPPQAAPEVVAAAPVVTEPIVVSEPVIAPEPAAAEPAAAPVDAVVVESAPEAPVDEPEPAVRAEEPAADISDAPVAIAPLAVPAPQLVTPSAPPAAESPELVEAPDELAPEEPEAVVAALPPLAAPLPPRDPNAAPLPLVAPLTRPEVQLQPEVTEPEATEAPTAEAPASELAPLAAPLPPRSADATPLPLVAALPPQPTPDVTIEPPPPEAAPAISEGFVWPVDGVVTSGYGWRWGRMHNGVDIPGPVGSPIVAVQSGTVIFAGWHDGGYGLMVEIEHPNGMITRYAHGSEIFVSQGQAVDQSQTIMARGSTGWSTGPHLHFEVFVNGQVVDPVAYLP